MVEAQPHLSNIVRLQTDRADAAALEVAMLLKLYQRRLGGGLDNPIAIPASYQPASIHHLNNLSSTSITPTIPGSPSNSHLSASASPRSYDFDLPDTFVSPNSPASTMDECEDTGNPDMYAQMDPQLLEYRKERAMTWEDLKCRQPLFPGEGGGYWQFSSAEQVINGWR